METLLQSTAILKTKDPSSEIEVGSIGSIISENGSYTRILFDSIEQFILTKHLEGIDAKE